MTKLVLAIFFMQFNLLKGALGLIGKVQRLESQPKIY